MNRRTAGIMLTMGVAAAALADTSSAQNSPGSAALDASLRGVVERKDVPGVVALITDRAKVESGARRRSSAASVVPRGAIKPPAAG